MSKNSVKHARVNMKRHTEQVDVEQPYKVEEAVLDADTQKAIKIMTNCATYIKSSYGSDFDDMKRIIDSMITKSQRKIDKSTVYAGILFNMYEILRDAINIQYTEQLSDAVEDVREMSMVIAEYDTKTYNYIDLQIRTLIRQIMHSK